MARAMAMAGVQAFALLALTCGYVAEARVRGRAASSRHAKLVFSDSSTRAPSADSSNVAQAPVHRLRTLNASSMRMVSRGQAPVKGQVAPCQCETFNPAWKQCPRREPSCVFLDLGAADGDTLRAFTAGKYGEKASCPSGKWTAKLIESNPAFEPQLQHIAREYGNHVTLATSTAGYMCEADATLYVDDGQHGRNGRRSALKSHWQNTLSTVQVKTMNLNRILYEETIPGDYVIVKMDIEGAEWDVIPCLSKSPMSNLVDALFVEKHGPEWGLAGTTEEDMTYALARLQQSGVWIPKNYRSSLSSR